MFDVKTSDIDEVLDQLDRLVELLGPEHTMSVHMIFLQTSNLHNLLCNLSHATLKSPMLFRQALKERFCTSNNYRKFANIKQNNGEDEVDYQLRLERAFQRIRKTTYGTPLTETEKNMLAEKLIAGLSDTSTRLKIREQNLKYEDIALRARGIRHAKLNEETTDPLVEKIALLSAQIAALSTQRKCSHYGKGHDTAA